MCVGSRVPWSWHYLNHLNNRPWHLICRGQFIVTARRKYFPIHRVIFSSHGVDIYLVLRNMKQSEAKNHGNVTTIPRITRRDFLMPVLIMFMRPVLMFAQQYTLGIHKSQQPYNTSYKPLSHTSSSKVGQSCKYIKSPAPVFRSFG